MLIVSINSSFLSNLNIWSADAKKVIPSSVLLEGEYGQNDICLGVPVVIGSNGWEEIIDLHLNKSEMEEFNKRKNEIKKILNVGKCCTHLRLAAMTDQMAACMADSLNPLLNQRFFITAMTEK